MSSKQDLFVNGRRISTKQSQHQNTRHTFTVGKDRYELNLTLVNRQMITGRLVKNGQVLSSRTLAPRWLLNKLKVRSA